MRRSKRSLKHGPNQHVRGKGSSRGGWVKVMGDFIGVHSRRRALWTEEWGRLGISGSLSSPSSLSALRIRHLSPSRRPNLVGRSKQAPSPYERVSPCRAMKRNTGR